MLLRKLTRISCADRANLCQYATAGHKVVDGWLEESAVTATLLIDNLQFVSGVQGALVEIGVHHGKYFILLCLLSREHEVAVGYDLFDERGTIEGLYGQLQRDTVELRLKKYFINLDKTRLLTADSTTLTARDVNNTSGSPVRFFSVDGDHSLAAVESDIRLASESLAEGGVVAVDDFFNAAWCGVAEAVIRVLSERKVDLVPFMIAGNKLFLTRGADWASRYRESMRTKFRCDDVGLRTSELMGSEVCVVVERPLSWTKKLLLATLGDRVVAEIRARRGYVGSTSPSETAS